LNAGFSTNESFAKVFKKSCGKSPRDFRNNPDWDKWETNYTLKSIDVVAVNIKNIVSRKLATIEHRGDKIKLTSTVNYFGMLIMCQRIRVQQGEAFALAYNDPDYVLPEEFYMDLGVSVKDSLKIKKPLFERVLPAGRYAVVVHKGSRENISHTTYGIFRDWLPDSGEELADYPVVFRYYNFESQVAETKLVTEVMLLLK